MTWQADLGLAKPDGGDEALQNDRIQINIEEQRAEET